LKTSYIITCELLLTSNRSLSSDDEYYHLHFILAQALAHVALAGVWLRAIKQRSAPPYALVKGLYFTFFTIFTSII